jgi:hypothetical protein
MNITGLVERFKQWKVLQIPDTGVCPQCSKKRGFDPKVWTLFPDYMCCKYCFQAQVADRDEQSKIRIQQMEKAIGTRAERADAPETPVATMVRDILNVVNILLVRSLGCDLKSQFPQVEQEANEAAREHVLARMEIKNAPPIIGRYLIGPELEDMYGQRLKHLIKDAPMTLVKDVRSVLTTPAIITYHQELIMRETPPRWLIKSMRQWTTDPSAFPLYSAAYVQALAANFEDSGE